MACILVVEDDGSVRDLIVEFLSGQGHDVAAAASAAEARNAIAARSIELVIADCVLYGEQGEAFAQHATGLGIPAILMTGDATRHGTVKGQVLPVLWKPFRLAELNRLVTATLAPSS